MPDDRRDSAILILDFVAKTGTRWAGSASVQSRPGPPRPKPDSGRGRAAQCHGPFGFQVAMVHFRAIVVGVNGD